MADEDILKKLEEQEIKLDKVFHSVEKTRKYFLLTLIITLIMFFLPLIGLIFIIPSFLSIYSSSLNF